MHLTHLATDWDRYCSSRKEVKRKIHVAEKEYVHNIIYDSQNKNSMWKVIRKCIPSKVMLWPAYTQDLNELANEFNAFFFPRINII